MSTTRCKPQGKATYRIKAVLIDRQSAHVPEDGTLVYKTQPYGCPRNGTMGQCYVADAETGRFIGMVSLNSLERAGTLPAE